MTKSDAFATVAFSAFILAMLSADCIPVLLVFMAIGIVTFVIADKEAK